MATEKKVDNRTMEEVEKDIIIDSKLNELVDPSISQDKLEGIKKKAKELIEQSSKSSDIKNELETLKNAAQMVWAFS
jgi:hypothetical protein